MGGPDTVGALQKFYNAGYSRVVLITDEQANGYYGYGYGNSRRTASDVVAPNTPLFTFNLVGYKAGSAEKANRVTLGGLTDQSFKMIPLLEAGYNADWDTLFSGVNA
jgi:hypothetical protein